MPDASVQLPVVGSARRSHTTLAMRRAARSMSSCSHSRTTSQPSDSSAPVVLRSRARLSATFVSQYRAFVRDRVQWSGQPCQKHPSTNTATRRAGNTTSGRTGLDPETRMGISTRNLRPARCNSDRSRSSGRVSRRRFARMMPRRISGTPGHGDSRFPAFVWSASIRSAALEPKVFTGECGPRQVA